MKGGKRQGAGRPQGGAKQLKRTIRDDFTKADVKRLVDKAKELALAGDTKMIAFLLEQIYGKAPQRLEMTGEDGKPFVITIAKEIAEQNDIN